MCESIFFFLSVSSTVVVQTDLYITGTIDVEKSTTSVQKLSERIALPPSSGLASVIFPGMYFNWLAKKWDCHMDSQNTSTVLGIEYSGFKKESCSSSKVIVNFLLRLSEGCQNCFCAGYKSLLFLLITYFMVIYQ